MWQLLPEVRRSVIGVSFPDGQVRLKRFPNPHITALDRRVKRRVFIVVACIHRNVVVNICGNTRLLLITSQSKTHGSENAVSEAISLDYISKAVPLTYMKVMSAFPRRTLECN